MGRVPYYQAAGNGITGLMSSRRALSPKPGICDDGESLSGVTLSDLICDVIKAAIALTLPFFLGHSLSPMYIVR